MRRVCYYYILLWCFILYYAEGSCLSPRSLTLDYFINRQIIHYVLIYLKKMLIQCFVLDLKGWEQVGVYASSLPYQWWSSHSYFSWQMASQNRLPSQSLLGCANWLLRQVYVAFSRYLHKHFGSLASLVNGVWF